MNTMNEKTTSKIQALYDCIQKRPRPEDVAELILEAIEESGTGMSRSVRSALEKSAKGSMKRSIWGYSSMAADFARPKSKVENQVKVASALFGVEALSAEDSMNPEKIEAFVRMTSEKIHKVYGVSDFKGDRMNREQRHALGLFKNAHWYNKRFRLLARMEEKIQKLVWETRKYLFTRIGKSAQAVNIPFEDFAADLNTACLVAYLSARMSMRSTFTNTSQVRAYDEVAEALFDRAVNAGTVRYDVLAYVMPDEKVLKHISEDQKGRMLGTWWALLTDMADMLKECNTKLSVNKETMIVEKGNDSSTWNQVAGGWNQARSHWISLVHSMGIEGILDTVCPGKVLRLMAADVAYWHRISGGAVHPDTQVWAALPSPWEVVNGHHMCTRTMVEAACAKAGVSVDQWTGAKKDRKPVAYTPTPELVHGVSVTSPALAAMLRKAKGFSGKVSRGVPMSGLQIQRDADGFALKVDPVGV